MVLVNNQLYPIPDQYKSFTQRAAIRNKENTKNMTSKQWKN